jgi:hypothetical protein
MIGPISRERFERRFPGGIPNPAIVVQRRYENSADKTLGFVALHKETQSWAAAVLKKKRGQFEITRQATALTSEREAVDALLQLFGLTDRGYREKIAEREFFERPDDKLEFLINTQWGFDPGYDQATKDRLDAPIEALTRKYFAEFYPELLGRLEAEPEQKSACSLQAFLTPCEALGAPVLGMIYLVAGRGSDPYLRIYVGREGFIEQAHNKVVEHLQTLANKPGAVTRAMILEGFEP